MEEGIPYKNREIDEKIDAIHHRLEDVQKSIEASSLYQNEKLRSIESTGKATPSITVGSTDTAGEITQGSISTGCVITFQTAYARAPFCTVTDQAGLVFSNDL